MEIQEYVDFVSGVVNKYQEIGDLINQDEISPAKLNRALSLYYNMSLALNAEYQRAKKEKLDLELEFQIWEDDHFEQAKHSVLSDYGDSKTKPSVTEYQTRLRSLFKEEWLSWKKAINDAEAKERFYLRLFTTLDKYDNILTTISYNMRSEMKALSIEDRSNKDPYYASNNKVRSEFPIPKRTPIE